jgi:hypothetical protein
LPRISNDRRRTIRGGNQRYFLTTLGIKKPGQLEEVLGSDFTPPVKTAWTEAYVTLAGVMRLVDRRNNPIDRPIDLTSQLGNLISSGHTALRYNSDM